MQSSRRKVYNTLDLSGSDIKCNQPETDGFSVGTLNLFSIECILQDFLWDYKNPWFFQDWKTPFFKGFPQLHGY